MSDFFNTIRETFSRLANSVSGFYSRNKFLVLSGITIVSILLIVWARLGFTFQISRFFAAGTSCENSGGVCVPSVYTNCSSLGLDSGSDSCDGSSSGDLCCMPSAQVPTQTPTSTPPPSGSVSNQHETLSCNGPTLIGPVWPAGGSPTVFRAILQCQADAQGRCDQANTAWVLDWGDNTPSGYCGGGSGGEISYGGCAKDASHTYATPGTYTVTLTCFADYVQHTTVGGLDLATPATWRPASQASTITVPAPNAALVPTPTPTAETFNGFCSYPGDVSRPECACNYGDNRSNQCHVCTESWQTGYAAYSNAQWAAWDSSGLCRPSCPANLPYETGRKKSDGSSFAFPEYCVEKPDDCPDGYHVVGANPGSCVSNATVPPSTPTPTATPTTTPTPTPTPAALSCSPATQNIAVSQAVTLTASGGSAPYTWAATGSSTPTGSGTSVTGAYAAPGTYTVTLTDAASHTAQCMVVVTQGAQTAPTIVATGRNVSTGSAESTSIQALPGQRIAVIARITNPSSSIVSDMTVRTALPPTVNYVSGSTLLNNAPAADITAVSSGIAVGALGAQQQAVVQFEVTAVTPATSATIPVQVVSSNATPSGQVILTINQAGQVGTVQTGPGDAVLFAALASAVATLLYVSYTKTSVYRRREIEKLGKDGNPLDFRS